MVVVDEEEFRRLPAAIAIYRAGLALALGDVAGTVTHARRALDLAAEDDHARARRGRRAPGTRVLDERGSRGRAPVVRRRHGEPAAGRAHSPTSSACAITLADIRIAQGRLREALRTYEQALQLAHRARRPVLRGTADMYVGMSELCRERNDLRRRHGSTC